jgi:hypothetical protein
VCGCEGVRVWVQLSAIVVNGRYLSRYAVVVQEGRTLGSRHSFGAIDVRKLEIDEVVVHEYSVAALRTHDVEQIKGRLC